MHGRAVTAAPCNVGKKRRKVDKKKRNDAHMTFGRPMVALPPIA